MGKEEQVKKLEKENAALKRALEDMARELGEHKTIFDSIPAMIFFKDGDNRLIRVNQAFAHEAGMNKSEIEGKSAFDVTYSKELAEYYWEDDKEVITSGQPKRDIIEPLFADKTRWFKTDKIPLSDSQGNIVGVICFSVDITNLEQAKSELKRRYEFEKLISTISTRFVKTEFEYLDKDINQSLKEIGEFLDVDRSYIFQYHSQDNRIVSFSNTHEWCREGIEPQKDNLQDLAVEDFYMAREVLMRLQVLNISSIDDLPEDAHKDREELQKEGIKSLICVPIFCGQVLYGFIGCDAVKRQRKWSNEAVSLLTIVGETVASALARRRWARALEESNLELERQVKERTAELETTDRERCQEVKNRKIAQKALAESEMRYKTLVETSPDAISMTDLQGRFIAVNEQELSLLGYNSLEELNDLGKTAFNLIHEDDRQMALENAQKTLEQGLVRNVQYRVIRKDGGTFPIELSASVIRDANGHSYAFMALTRDITERKKTETALANYRDKLEELVKERTAELSVVHERLRQSQKMEALGTLAGGVAHEFNNILAAIVGYTELALQDLESGDKEKSPVNASDLEYILKAVERAKNLVRRILTFSRKQRAELKPLLLNQVVSHTIEILKRTIPRMIDIKPDLSEELGIIRGDAGQLEQMLMNLGSNARDAMTEGGCLRIETQNVTLDEQYCKQYPDISPGEYVHLRFSDTGHGMDEETLQHIFDPFFTTKEVGKGTGLGLSTVFGIVKGHGGHLTCSSEPGKGTEFNIYLPVSDDKIRPSHHAGIHTQPIQGGDEVILVVDDEVTILDILNQILSRQGYKVITAARGEEALEIYLKKGKEIDLVILDIDMPGMGGRRCLKELHEINPGVSIIIASGYIDNDQLNESLSSGISGFAAKPYRRTELLKTVRRVLDRDKK